MKEIVLENDKLRIVVLPEAGGKISSLFYLPCKFEAAARPGPGKTYRKPEADGSFGDYDMSGIDDCFPNIDTETFSYEGRILYYPDHGEIWSREMDVIKQTGDSLFLSLQSRRFHYNYEKRLFLRDSSLRLEYDISNPGNMELPCIWTLHGLMRLEADMRFEYPKGVRAFVNVLKDTPLGEEGRRFEYPSEEFDFTRLYGYGEPEGMYEGPPQPYYMKYYAPQSVTEGRLAISYPSQSVRVEFSYDPLKLPWFGVWINHGGFGGDYNVAMEMTNGYYDLVSRAIENQRIRVLRPGERISFEVVISITGKKVKSEK
ncbi:MAG TPA: hypothetical protein DCW47_07750 [Lachnospiraceae bacterium]|nr:hypothetical protein [Lachnospiraceae bacterium]